MNAKKLERLLNYIDSTHHFYIQKELPRLSELMSKVAMVHGQQHPELIYLRRFFDDFGSSIEREADNEQRYLFDIMIELSQASGPLPEMTREALRGVTRMFLTKGSRLERGIQQLRSLSDDFTPPSDACNSYKALFQGLQDFSSQLEMELNLEKTLLLPHLRTVGRSSVYKEAG